MPKIRETIRDDGLKIVSCCMPNEEELHVEIIIGVGSAHDPPGKTGLFHLFEHTAFKGTKTRTADEIFSIASRCFTDWQAVTENTTTLFMCNAHHSKLAEACRILLDICFNSVFPENELAVEKRNVRKEILGFLDDESSPSFLALWKELWKHNPLREYGVGTLRGIARVTRRDMVQARDQWYLPSNAVVLAVGKVDHKKFVQLVDELIPIRKKRVEKITWGDEYESLPRKNRVILKPRGRKLTILRIGCKFPLFTDDRTNITSILLQRLLMGSEQSPLWHAMREKYGIAYEFGGRVTHDYPLGAFFTFYAEVEPKSTKLAERLVKEILTEALPEKNYLREAKEWLQDFLRVQAGKVAQWRNLLVNKMEIGVPPETLEDYFDSQISLAETITFEEVENLRAMVFKPERLVTIIHPAK